MWPKICTNDGSLTTIGFPIMYDSSGKRKPVREKVKDKTEKMIDAFIKNFN